MLSNMMQVVSTAILIRQRTQVPGEPRKASKTSKLFTSMQLSPGFLMRMKKMKHIMARLDVACRRTTVSFGAI